MKKYLLTAIMVMLSLYLFGQTWSEDKAFETLLTRWEVTAEVWITTTPDGKTALTIKDSSDNDYDAKKQLQTSLYAISSQLKQTNKVFKDLNIAYIGYSWLSPTGRIDVVLDNEWLTKYFVATDKEKLSMINIVTEKFSGDKLTLPNQPSTKTQQLPQNLFPLKQ